MLPKYVIIASIMYLIGHSDGRLGPTFLFCFFQAEDGIRDDLVTGVQTCALPISVSVGIRAKTQRPSPKDANRAPFGPGRRTTIDTLNATLRYSLDRTTVLPCNSICHLRIGFRLLRS